MKEITLKCGAVVFVDDGDHELVAAHNWHVSHNGYAVRRVRKPDGTKPIIYMHREIFGMTAGDIDHADGNRLNNTRSNLRDATRTQNNANSRMRGGSSQFKGVCWHRQIRRWIAYISFGGKRKHIGTFRQERAAAEAYNEAAKKLFGEFARLNPV